MQTNLIESGYSVPIGFGNWIYVAAAYDTVTNAMTIFTNPPPTAPSTNIVDQGATNMALYYRMKVKR